MTDTTPETYVRDLLRTYLTDPNPSRVASSEFIASRWPRDTDLTINHFPRISIIRQFNSSRPFEIGTAAMWQTPRLQLDVWVKPDHVLTIDGVETEGGNQVTLLADAAEQAIRTNWISYLASTNKLIILRNINWYPAKMDYTFSLWRLTGDITFNNIRE